MTAATSVGWREVQTPPASAETPGTSRRTRVDVSTLVGTAMGGAVVVGMMVSQATGTVAAGVALLAAVVSPATGLVTLVFTAALKPPAGIPQPGFGTFLVGAIVLGCVYRLPVDRPQLRLTLPLVLLLAFVGYVAVQQLPAMLEGYLSRTGGNEVGYLFFQLVSSTGAVVAAAHVLRGRNPYPVLVGGVAGALVVAMLAIVTFGATSVEGPLGNLITNPDDLSRALGPFVNPNYFGFFVAIAATMTLGWIVVVGRARPAILLGVVLLVLGVALSLSLSRGAIVAFLAGVAATAFAHRRRTGFLVLVIGAFLTLVVYPAFLAWRLESLQGSASALAYVELVTSDQWRLTGVLAGPQLFLSSPLLGIGFGQYAAASTTLPGVIYPIEAHNWYTNVLAEQGLVGAVLWTLLLITVALQLRSRPPAARMIGMPVFVALVVGSLFLHPPTSFQTVVLPSVVIVAALVADWSPRGSQQSDDRRRDATSPAAA